MYVSCVRTLDLGELFHIEKLNAPQARGYRAFITAVGLTATISPSVKVIAVAISRH